ncbi:hypothetical protein HYY74_01260 [Candidatus Woesearchaeota archaeon]|nr:hypothetical protein [Candidatus Woesearchaeota archaeon]
MLLRKGQNWSFDAMLAVGIFLLVIISFFYITSKASQGKKLDFFADEAGRIPDIFNKAQNDTLIFMVDGNKVDRERLENFSGLDYRDVKARLGIRSDFCIHFEDEQGNLIFINETANITGFGSSKAVVSNITCRER